MFKTNRIDYIKYIKQNKLLFHQEAPNFQKLHKLCIMFSHQTKQCLLLARQHHWRHKCLFTFYILISRVHENLGICVSKNKRASFILLSKKIPRCLLRNLQGRSKIFRQHIASTVILDVLEEEGGVYVE